MVNKNIVQYIGMQANCPPKHRSDWETTLSGHLDTMMNMVLLPLFFLAAVILISCICCNRAWGAYEPIAKK